MVTTSLKNILDTIGLKLNLNNELLSLSFELENMFDTYIFDDEEKGYKCYYSKDSTCYIMIYEEPVDGVILDLLHSPDEQSQYLKEYSTYIEYVWFKKMQLKFNWKDISINKFIQRINIQTNWHNYHNRQEYFTTYWNQVFN